MTQEPVRRLNWIVATSYFRPDHAGIAIYSTDFVDYLVERGENVQVITTFPFYPSWRKRPEDRRRLFSRTEERGYGVLRGYSYVPERVTTIKRMAHEASSAIFALFNLVRAKRGDVIVVFSPPLALCLVAWLWARLTGAMFVINVQDLPVDAARSLGMMRQSLLLRVIEAVEGWIYRRADQIVTISHSMRDQLRRKHVPQESLGLVPNWIDVARHAAEQPRGEFRKRHGIPDGAFLISYAGNIGVKQGLDQLVEIANAFRAKPHFKFVIAGEGADKARIEDLVRKSQLDNITLLPFLSPEEYGELLCDSDLIFVGQRAAAGDNFFPSKLLGIMAKARPLLVAADGTSELASEVVRSNCGLVAQYGDTDTLESLVSNAAAEPDRLVALGLNGRASVRRFDRQAVLSEWLSSVRGRLASRDL